MCWKTKTSARHQWNAKAIDVPCIRGEVRSDAAYMPPELDTPGTYTAQCSMRVPDNASVGMRMKGLLAGSECR